MFTMKGVIIIIIKIILLHTVLHTGFLTVSAAAIEPAVAPVEVQEEKPVVVEAVEPAEAPVEVQEEKPVAENEVEAVAPKVEAPEGSSAGEVASSVEGRFFACPAGWLRYKNGCYLVVTTSRSWSNAAAFCSSLGASLPSVSNVFDYSYLQELTRRAGYTVAWMGGFYFQGWRWVDESAFNYQFWNAQYSATSYPCIYINARVGWSNANCATTWPSICVKKIDTC